MGKGRSEKKRTTGKATIRADDWKGRPLNDRKANDRKVDDRKADDRSDRMESDRPERPPV
jgi:hypothetical protein